MTNFNVNWKEKKEDEENSYVMLSEFVSFLDQEGIETASNFEKKIHDLVLQTVQTADLTVHHSDLRCF